MKVFFYTSFALIAFAFNSILCRLALRAEAIDATSFTTVRLFSGAVTLLIISALLRNENESDNKKSKNSVSAFFLFAYAVCFSFAYTELTTATAR